MTAGTCKEGAEATIYRALALRHMELPVGDFITDALSTEVPDLARKYSTPNVQDEENHDVALGYVADAYGVDEKAEAEALRLKAAWEAHPDHTITKALVAERAIFFVLLPFFRFNGDAGMRTISADISRDEQVHVAVNSLVQLSWATTSARLWTSSARLRSTGSCSPSVAMPINIWTKNFGSILVTA